MKTKIRPQWMMSTDRNEWWQQNKVNKVDGPKGMTTTEQSEQGQRTKRNDDNRPKSTKTNDDNRQKWTRSMDQNKWRQQTTVNEVNWLNKGRQQTTVNEDNWLNKWSSDKTPTRMKSTHENDGNWKIQIMTLQLKNCYSVWIKCKQSKWRKTDHSSKTLQFFFFLLLSYSSHAYYLTTPPPTKTKLDPNTKRFKRMLIYWHGHTICKFSGKSPLSSYKMTLKQQLNGYKLLKMRKKLIFFWLICCHFRKIVCMTMTSWHDCDAYNLPTSDNRSTKRRYISFSVFIAFNRLTVV